MRYQAAPLPEPCCHLGQALEQHNPTMASIRTGNRRFCWLSTINPRNAPGTCSTAVMAQNQNADGSYTFSSSPLGLKGQQTLPIFCASVTGTGWSKCAVCVLVYLTEARRRQWPIRYVLMALQSDIYWRHLGPTCWDHTRTELMPRSRCSIVFDQRCFLVIVAVKSGSLFATQSTNLRIRGSAKSPSTSIPWRCSSELVKLAISVC